MIDKTLSENPRKNKFDLSREVKMTGNMGWLYPAFIQDVIPGDSYRVNTQQLIRFSPLLAPMMHRIDFKIDYFFVPYRLVWDEWKDFITGGEDGNDLPSYPRVRINTNERNNYFQKGQLADYFGIPPQMANDSVWDEAGNAPVDRKQEIGLLKFRAYQLIYHEYFRDQNVGTEYEQHTSSGISKFEDLVDQMTIRRSNWEKDYFTSALPFLQRGTEVTLPLGGTAPIVYEDGNLNYVRDINGNLTGDNRILGTNPVGSGGVLSDRPDTVNAGTTANLDNSQSLLADLSQATATTINELRKATALQRWLELMARAGSRYREQIFAMFGERIPDYTVQVPQHLGGGKTPIMISEVLSTYQSEGTTDRPQGDMSGHAIGVGDNLGFTQSFDEHGVIIGLARVIPKSSYTQGLSKFWQKFDKFDHYFPQFANLGEQEVKNKELYVTGDEQVDNQVFGYQQRYAEYKYSFNRIAGDFRDNLSQWELSRRFNTTPVLNQTFIECTPDDRIFAITDPTEDKLWIQLYHKVDAVRPIPYHSNPSLT